MSGNNHQTNVPTFGAEMEFIETGVPEMNGSPPEPISPELDDVPKSKCTSPFSTPCVFRICLFITILMCCASVAMSYIWLGRI